MVPRPRPRDRGGSTIEGRLARWSPLSGIVFVVLSVVAGVIFMDAPAPGASDDTILSYYADSGNQRKFAIAFLRSSSSAPGCSRGGSAGAGSP